MAVFDQHLGELPMSPAAPRETDASKLSFPLQLVIYAVTTAIMVALSVTAASWSLKSDVRDMSTRLELREDNYRQDREVLTAQLKSQAAKVEMLQVDVTDLKLALAKSGRSGL